MAADARGAVLSLWRARGLLGQMVAADLRGRYVGSTLGLLWHVVQPLVLILIYTVVFTSVFAPRLGSADPWAFSLHLCAGLLPWTAAAEILTRGTGVFIESASLVKKVAFPRLLLPLHVLAAAAIHFTLIAALFLVVLAVAGRLPPPAVVALWLLLSAVQLIGAAGLALLASVLHVFFRDTAPLVAMLLPLWFWMTPIVYTADVLPATVRTLLGVNPAAAFALRQQNLLLRGELPGLLAVGGLALGAATAVAMGVGAYAGLRREIPDEL